MKSHKNRNLTQLLKFLWLINVVFVVFYWFLSPVTPVEYLDCCHCFEVHLFCWVVWGRKVTRSTNNLLFYILFSYSFYLTFRLIFFSFWVILVVRKYQKLLRNCALEILARYSTPICCHDRYYISWVHNSTILIFALILTSDTERRCIMYQHRCFLYSSFNRCWESSKARWVSCTNIIPLENKLL